MPEGRTSANEQAHAFPPTGPARRLRFRESGDPNPCVCDARKAPQDGMIDLAELSRRTGASTRWLRREISDGRLSAWEVDAPKSRYGFKWVVNEDVVERTKMRFLRKRRTQVDVGIKGYVRDGVVYGHDGSAKSTKTKRKAARS